MAYSNKDKVGSVTVHQAIPAAAYTTAQATAAGIDCGVFRSATVVVNYGVITDGTITPSLTSSDTLSGSYTAETNTTGTITAGTASTDVVSVAFGIDTSKAKRFIKVLMNESVASAGYIVGATLVGDLKRVNSSGD